ncbi:hypothetical protein ACJMK2_032133 [Sinanodonta woodiana]|uniref:PLAT domain-containing protein n=1 Tax=Sinanodonta woodiana TaxID=1069815 RepID=A0ABD3X0U7_SINWO
MNSVKYEIFVRTGDKLFSGTDANVFIVLHGENGKKSGITKLDCFFHNDLERGQLDQYAVECINLGKIYTIELWRDDAGLKSNWYVDYIKVVDTASSVEYSFPILRWIKAGYHYRIAHLDTSLPADDPHVGQRLEGLRDKREAYVLRKGPYHLPAQVKLVLIFACLVFFLEDQPTLVNKHAGPTIGRINPFGLIRPRGHSGPAP